MTDSLTNAGDVIDALDGTTAVARLTRRKPQHVTNWRASGRLPSATYLILMQALGARGKTAPAALWGIDEAPGSIPEPDADRASEPEQVQS